METTETKNYNPRMTERGNKHKKALTIYIDPELMRKFKSLCALNDKSMTTMIEEFIRKYVERKD